MVAGSLKEQRVWKFLNSLKECVSLKILTPNAFQNLFLEIGRNIIPSTQAVNLAGKLIWQPSLTDSLNCRIWTQNLRFWYLAQKVLNEWKWNGYSELKSIYFPQPMVPQHLLHSFTHVSHPRWLFQLSGSERKRNHPICCCLLNK